MEGDSVTVVLDGDDRHSIRGSDFDFNNTSTVPRSIRQEVPNDLTGPQDISVRCDLFSDHRHVGCYHCRANYVLDPSVTEKSPLPVIGPGQCLSKVSSHNMTVGPDESGPTYLPFRGCLGVFVALEDGLDSTDSTGGHVGHRVDG